MNVYDYLDYRLYLEDYCRTKKETQLGFSYRVFCRKAEIRSAGYLSDVISGRRSLSREYAAKFAKALNLDAKGEAYLKLLVSYKHAKAAKSKQALHEQLMAALPLRIRRLRNSQLDYFSRWHNVALRELLSVRKFRDEYAEMAALLRPSITAAQAEEAVGLLERLGLIERDEEGYWRACHRSLVTKGEEADSIFFRTFRQVMAAKGVEALVQIPYVEQRCFNITLSVSPSGMERLVECMKQFHRRVIETVQADTGEDRVVQVNLHAFPITRTGIGHAA